MNGVTDGVAVATQRYREGLRRELHDLPESEVSEILHDVGTSLDDVGAELGPDQAVDADRYPELVARLGEPAHYAAELRAAAGYPPTPTVLIERPQGQRAAQVAVAVLVASCGLVLLGGLTTVGGFSITGMLFLTIVALFLLCAAVPGLFGAVGGPSVPAVAALPTVRRFRAAAPEPGTPAGQVAAFLVSLQPAWWVVRALLAAGLLAAVFGRGGTLSLLLAALVTVPVSIWLGFASRRDRRWLWLVAPLTVFAAFVLLAWVLDQVRPTSTSFNSYVVPGLAQDGRSIQDVRPFDANGNPLTGVYLFDQDGQPIEAAWTCDQIGAGAPDARAPYPRGTAVYDEFGQCRMVPPGPVVVAIPVPTTAPAPAVTPGATAPPDAVTSTPPVPAAPTG